MYNHDKIGNVNGTSVGGGNAGHNGLKDITQKLATLNFWRLRIGTGHPRTLGLRIQVVDFVLGKPTPEQMQSISSCITAGIDCMADLADGNFQAAQRKIAPFGKHPDEAAK